MKKSKKNKKLTIRKCENKFIKKRPNHCLKYLIRYILIKPKLLDVYYFLLQQCIAPKIVIVVCVVN